MNHPNIKDYQGFYFGYEMYVDAKLIGKISKLKALYQ